MLISKEIVCHTKHCYISTLIWPFAISDDLRWLANGLRIFRVLRKIRNQNGEIRDYYISCMAKYEKCEKYDGGALRYQHQFGLLPYATICNDLRMAFAYFAFCEKYEIRMPKFKIIILVVWRNTKNTIGAPLDININLAFCNMRRFAYISRWCCT